MVVQSKLHQKVKSQFTIRNMVTYVYVLETAVMRGTDPTTHRLKRKGSKMSLDVVIYALFALFALAGYAIGKVRK